MGLSTPLVERNRCNCAALRKASRRLSQFYDSALALVGPQIDAVRDLLPRSNGDRMRPPTIRDLAEALVMDQSTIGQNLRPLERDGLIALEEDANGSSASAREADDERPGRDSWPLDRSGTTPSRGSKADSGSRRPPICAPPC